MRYMQAFGVRNFVVGDLVRENCARKARGETRRRPNGGKRFERTTDHRRLTVGRSVRPPSKRWIRVPVAHGHECSTSATIFALTVQTGTTVNSTTEKGDNGPNDHRARG